MEERNIYVAMNKCQLNLRSGRLSAGLLPLVHLILEDKVDMLTRMTVDIMSKTMETDYVWESERIPLVVETLIHALTKGKRR